MSSEPRRLWYDWMLLVTVCLFVASAVFFVMDIALAYRPTRIVAALLCGGVCGLVGMSIAEDINLEFRYSRKYQEEKNGQ